MMETASSALISHTGIEHDDPMMQTQQLSGHVVAESETRPLLPTFDSIPVEIRLMIYSYILVPDTNISLRSASEMRARISHREESSIPLEVWRAKHPSQLAWLENESILFVSRMINQEATHFLCANNNFHYSCIRSFPGARIDLCDSSRPIPFSGRHLKFMKSLSLDYCKSHYRQLTNAGVANIDSCIARNISHINNACPSLKTFSLYIFSQPLLTPHFSHGRLGTGHTALALRELCRRLDRLNIDSLLPDCAIDVFTRAIAPGAIWQILSPGQSGLPRVTSLQWQILGMCGMCGSRRVIRLDCKKAMEIDAEAEKGASNPCGLTFRIPLTGAKG